MPGRIGAPGASFALETLETGEGGRKVGVVEALVSHRLRGRA
jgi:hypothetical protein